MQEHANLQIRRIKPHHFPSGAYRVIAMLGLEPAELAERCGVQFDEAFADDGLGILRFAAFQLANSEPTPEPDKESR